MHLLESYALNTGLKIDKPYILDKFVPLPFQGKYISFQPYSKVDSKNYDYWKDVLDILEPILNKESIRIVQCGLEKERLVQGAFDFRGRTTLNQLAYLIRHSELHLGTDSCGAHIASGLGKKIVGLYSIMYSSQCGPYWSDPKRVRCLEPHREEGKRPSYSNIELNKTINTIPPEKIARSVCELLGLEFNFPYKTIYTGPNYKNKRVELIPESWIENIESFAIDSIIVRMDKKFNEKALQMQLQKCNCSIVTEKPIDLKIISFFKRRIKELVYMVDENTDEFEYLHLVKDSGVNLMIMSSLEGEKLNKIKLKYLDLGKIFPHKKFAKDSIEELKGKNCDDLYFRSNIFTVRGEYCYSSKDDSFYSTPIDNISKCPYYSVIDSEDFWSEIEHFTILEKA